MTLISMARAGTGGVLVVQGEPGAGKSTLLDAAATLADGFDVLRTRGIQSEAELAFSGLTELLAPLSDLVDGLPAEQRRTLRSALDARGTAPAGQLPLATAVLALLTTAARRRPVLALVDDAHWLDGSSLAAVGFVARRLASAPIALVVARRGSEPGVGAAGAVEVRLRGLGAEAARGLLADLGVEARIGAAANLTELNIEGGDDDGDADRRAGTVRGVPDAHGDSDDVGSGADVSGTAAPNRERRSAPAHLRLAADEFDRLLAETRGNPLALIEMARLAASGALDLATLAGGREPLPSGVQLAGLYHDQVITLPERARRALLTAAASFTGDAAPIEAALHSARLDLTDLAPAEQAGHVELSDGTVRFAHPLLRSAIYHGATDDDVRDAHNRLAAALSTTAGPAAREQHAWHRSYATTGPDAPAATELAEVAAAAARRGAPTAARQAYQRAATIAPDPTPYLVEAAVCARVEGDVDAALDLLDAAEATLQMQSTDIEEKTSAAQASTADRTAPDAPTAEATEPGSAGRTTPAADPDTASRVTSTTAEAAEPSTVGQATSGLLTRIHTERARATLSRTDPARLMTDLAEAAETAPDPAHAADLTVAATGAAILGAHYAQARDLAALALDRAAAPVTRTAASAVAEHLALLLGEPAPTSKPASPEPAPKLPSALGEPAPTPDRQGAFDPADLDTPLEALVYPAWTAALRGAPYPHLAAALKAAHDAGALSRLPPLLTMAAELDQRAGHWDVARGRALAAADLGADLGQPLWPAFALAVAARIAAYRGDRADFADLENRLAALPATPADHPAELAFRHARAILDIDEDGAAEELQAVEATLHKLGIRHPAFIPVRADLDELLDRDTEADPEIDQKDQDPFQSARHDLHQARRLRDRRHHAEARALLEPARDTFRRLRARRWEALCEAELASLSTSAAKKTAAPTILTQYETQVARHVGAGRTNNETAAALYISPKTVEYHLRNLYKKLGIRSRTELARIVATWDRGPKDPTT